MDALKKNVVDKIAAKIRELQAEVVFEFPPGALAVRPDLGRINVMQKVEPLVFQLHVKTPNGPRFFTITVRESLT